MSGPRKEPREDPIRPVTADAVPQLARIHATGFEEPWGTDAIADVLAMPGVFGLMVLPPDSADISGFLLARVAGDEAEILTVAVAENARRRGSGRRLVEAAAALACVRGAATLFLEVAEDNPGAIALYEKLGFSTVGRRPGYYRRGARGTAAALTMRLDLPPAPEKP